MSDPHPTRPRRGVTSKASMIGVLRSLFRPARPAPPGHATDLDRQMMARAIELARRAADLGEVPVGAVVYETATGRALAEAFNTRERDADPTAHAELVGVREAARVLGDWRLNACTLVVTLEPCTMCAGLLVNARVGRVVYGAADPKAGACRSLFAITTDARLNHRCEVVSGVEAEACGQLLRDFFRARRGARRAEHNAGTNLDA